MNKIIVFIAALALSACSAPSRVVLRIDRSACMRVDKISKDVELVVINCDAPSDTILVIKDVAIADSISNFGTTNRILSGKFWNTRGEYKIVY